MLVGSSAGLEQGEPQRTEFSSFHKHYDGGEEKRTLTEETKKRKIL